MVRRSGVDALVDGRPEVARCSQHCISNTQARLTRDDGVDNDERHRV